MIDDVPLDAGVVGLLCSSPGYPNVMACEAWRAGLKSKGTTLVVADLTQYEVRRELLRVKAKAKLRRLDALLAGVTVAEVSSDAWIKAAEFWAIVRQAGRPTAAPNALDGDAILAGVAATLGRPGDQVIIATTNVRHLSWFPGIDARRWEVIP